jgi:hypothetical protein
MIESDSNPGEDPDIIEAQTADSGRPLDDSSLKQVRPGTPLGVAKHHIYTHVRHALGGPQAVKAAYVKLELPDLLRRRVIGFLGNFGSGKTEVAVNFALQLGLAASEPDDAFSGPVRIVDLDIINPYFRSREAAEPLEEAGVEVVMPAGPEFWADLPIILPEVRGAIKRSDGTVILDVGGDDLGARVLSHIKGDFVDGEYTLTMVVNANRPFTSSVSGARKVLDELETAAGLRIGALVSNTHLMNETTPDEVRRGYGFAKEMGQETGLPVVLVAAEGRVINIDEGGTGGANGIRAGEFDCPVLPLYRFMLPPWHASKRQE